MAYPRYGGNSGHEYNRWVERNSNNSAFGKVQKQFWFTKSAVLRKFGKKEDEHIVASDAELDAKIDMFSAIEETTKELRGVIGDYQTRICVLAQEENSLGKLLKEYGNEDRTKAGKMMVAIGKSLNYIAQHRIGMRNPLVRLYQEVDTFQLRAVEDTHRTVEEMEKVRTEYRGALMWMKNISQDFNPDHYQQLEKFREVQAIVKRKKGRFDQLKVKCLQKIDLLAASRCNMFSHALILYQSNLITISEKTAKTLKDISSKFEGYEPYKFQVIKELSDPLEDLEDSLDSTRSVAKVESTKSTNVNDAEGESECLISLLDKSDEFTYSPSANADSQNDFSNIDLLTDNVNKSPDSDSAQKLLKEWFDSPVHSYQHIDALPIFGCSDNNSTEEKLQNKDAKYEMTTKNTEQFFLPSQLIDFGFNEAEALYPSHDLNLQKDHIATGKNITKGVKISPSFQEHVTSKEKTLLQTNKINSKLDWFKVFQDIDPLADEGNNIFLKGYDNKQC